MALTCFLLGIFGAIFIKKLNPLRAKWPIEPALISDFCSIKRIRVFDSPWTGTNPSQVSSQQTLVLIYLPRKMESELAEAGKRVAQISSILCIAEDRTGDLVVGRQRSYQLRQSRPPIFIRKLFLSHNSSSGLLPHSLTFSRNWKN